MAQGFMPNAFMKGFGLQNPCVGGAMAGFAGYELAGAVARGGGFGFIGAGRHDPAQIKDGYSKAQQLAEGRGAVGIGLLNFAASPEQCQAVVEAKAKAVWLFAGDLQPHVTPFLEAGIPIFAQVNTLDEVEAAVKLGAAVIIAQGEEAGGHGRRGASTLSFVPEAVDLVRALCKDGRSHIPVLAAGGIADARQAAAALMLGAEGVVLGTRLVATDECNVHQRTKQALVEAGSQARDRPATIATGLFDDLDAPANIKQLGATWPYKCIARALQTPFTDQWGRVRPLKEADAEQLRQQMADAKKAGDLQTAPVWAGTGVGLIKSIEPADKLVSRMAAELADVLRHTSGMVHANGGP